MAAPVDKVLDDIVTLHYDENEDTFSVTKKITRSDSTTKLTESAHDLQTLDYSTVQAFKTEKLLNRILNETTVIKTHLNEHVKFLNSMNRTTAETETFVITINDTIKRKHEDVTLDLHNTMNVMNKMHENLSASHSCNRFFQFLITLVTGGMIYLVINNHL